MRLNRNIARRRRLARWGKWLLLPTVLVILALWRSGPWIYYPGFALFTLEALAMMQGELLRCPVCDASLVTGRGRWNETVAGTCPECDLPID